MNKRHTTMIASIAAVTMVGAMLMISGIFGKAIALNPTGAPDYTVPPRGSNGLPGEATKIIVEIESPYGNEKITSFKSFNTDNLMKKTGYHTLRLQGPIMSDKRTLMHWVGQDIGKMPDGLATDGVITHGGTEVKMTKAAAGTTIDKIPMTGRVTLLVLESWQDMYAYHELRKLEFSGCMVAGYHTGAFMDNDKPYFPNGVQYYEEVDFACTTVDSLGGTGITDSRGIIVDRAINNDDRKIMNEKGELIIESREYRQPIVMDQLAQDESTQSLRQEIVTTVVSDKVNYEVGDVANFTVTFADLEGNAINPETIKAYYDGKLIQLEQQDLGVYTYVTLGLTKTHHQLIVSAEKEDFATDTVYLSIPIHRIS
jgi:hypothetical protein